MMRHKRLARQIAGMSAPDGMWGYIPLPDEDDGPADGGPNDDDGAKDDDKPKVFTQDEVNSLLAKERRTTEGKYADYKDLKTKAAAHDKAVEDAKTETQKAVDTARAEGKTEGITAGNARLVAAEARAVVAEARFAKPDLAVRALDLADVKVSDDGEVDTEAIKTKVKELVDSGAFVIDDGTTTKRPKVDHAQGGSTKGKDGKSLKGLSGDELYDRLHPKKTTA